MNTKDTILNQICIIKDNIIQKMYEDNKNIVNLYQEFYTKYNISKEDIKKMEKELKDIDKLLKDMLKIKDGEIEMLREENIELSNIIINNGININNINVKSNKNAYNYYIFENYYKEKDIKILNYDIKINEPEEYIQEIKNNDNKIIYHCDECMKELSDTEVIHIGSYTYCIECNNNQKEWEEENDTPLPTPSSSSDNSIKEEIVCKRFGCKRVVDKNNSFDICFECNNIGNDPVETNIKEKIENGSSAVETAPKKIQKSRNKELPILERFGTKYIKEEDIKDSEILRFVGEEDCFNIEYQYLVANKIDKNQENITIDDVVEFKIKYEKKRNTKTRRKEYRYLITRCNYLFEKYKKNLGKFKFSLYNISSMSDDDWNEYKEAFDILYREIFKDSIECDAIIKSGYNKGNKCNRLNCKIHKDNI